MDDIRGNARSSGSHSSNIVIRIYSNIKEFSLWRSNYFFHELMTLIEKAGEHDSLGDFLEVCLSTFEVVSSVFMQFATTVLYRTSRLDHI